MPSRNPMRMPESSFAKNRTRQDVNRYHPDDSPEERQEKARQNFGDDLEAMVDLVAPEIRDYSNFLGDLAEYGAGYYQKGTPGRQKREALVDRMREHNARRYSNRERAATNYPLSTKLDGFLVNRFGLYGLPTVSGLAEERRYQATKNRASSE